MLVFNAMMESIVSAFKRFFLWLSAGVSGAIEWFESLPVKVQQVSFAALVVALLTLLTLWAVRRWRRGRNPFPLLILAPSLEGVEMVDTAVARILQETTTWVEGEAFHAYWLNEKGTNYRLRASLSTPTSPLVAVNYSGLVNEDVTPVPLSMPVEGRSDRPVVVGGRMARWLEIPLGYHCLIRVHLDPEYEIHPRLMERFAAVSQTARPLMLAIYEWFKAKEATDRADSLMDSSQLAMDTTLRPEKAIELLLRVGTHLLDAKIGTAVVAGDQGPIVMSDSPLGEETGQHILRRDAPALLMTPVGPEVVPGQHLGLLGNSYNACVRVPVTHEGQVMGCLFYFTDRATSLDRYQGSVLQTLAGRIGQLVASQRLLNAASEGYLETLRTIVEAYDSLSPYSVGHSDRIARYARMTAQQLRLPPEEVDAIALAAYFHDVGMVAVDPRIVLKPGRVTADEMEQIKVHAELGGQMVRSLSREIPIDPLVAAHHERWDGHGYPKGLKGEEIPIGARIIAVADLFDAKTTGRSYRQPRPFIDAIADLRLAMGSGLDPEVASAFIEAWERQRSESLYGQKPQPCWEIKQLPAHVCAGCPNRTDTFVRCWENKAHLCSRHGDQCETCVVYTENASRGLTLR
jgi:HD-GYP domain-containing protein (c-di-GMP phosphodiesterase class II)